MIGASAHTEEEREKDDYYATEPKALELLLDTIDFDLHRLIWECACGGGHLCKVLTARGYEVLATDIVNRDNTAMQLFDFLSIKDFVWQGDIVTNPPFKIAEKFVEQGISVLEEGRYLILFQRIMFLESSRRHTLFQKHPPKYIYVHSSRVGTAKGGDFERYASGGKTMCYAWFVWQKGYKGESTIRWIQ